MKAQVKRSSSKHARVSPDILEYLDVRQDTCTIGDETAEDSTKQSGDSGNSGTRSEGSMSPDSCFSSCPCGGVFVTGQNHDTGRLSARHKVPSVMQYQVPDCFLSCTSTLLR